MKNSKNKHPSSAVILLISPIFCLLNMIATAQAQELPSIGDIKPVSLDGSVTLSLTKYSVEGAERRRPATSWTIVGAPTLSFYGMSLPFTFILSDQESFTRQPFNQIGVSPSYKSVTLHLGYRSLTYSKYSLSGITFLGAGVDLTPGPLRFSAMYGRFQRAVEEDTNDLSILPAYERIGFAGKVGIGGDKSFFDLIYLHSKDDSSSLKLNNPPLLMSLYPSENVVIGLNSKLYLIDELVLEMEGAGSFFTRDVRSPRIDSSKIPVSLQSLIDVKSSTSLTLASSIGLALELPHFRLRVGYDRIEPEYSSHGAYYFTTDVENFTVAPSFDISDGKLRVSGSIGIQNDNVLGTRLSKTERIIGSGNVSFNPVQVFGIDLNYTNYSTNQQLSTNPLLRNDSVRVRNVSQSASLTPRLLFISPTSSQSIIFSGSYQEFRDLNVFSSQYSNSRTKTGSFNYNISFFESGLNLGASILYANSIQTTATTDLIGFNFNGSKSFVDNKLTLGASFGMTFNTIEPLGSKSTTFNESINANYRIFEQGTLTLAIYGTQNSSGLPGYTTTPYREATATLSYTHNFSF